MKGKIYSAKEINTTAANEEEQWLKIDKGLFVVVAPEPTNSRRVVGKVVINKKPFKYSFGSFHIKLKESHIELYKSKWTELRTWAKENKCDPNLFDVQLGDPKLTKTFEEVVELFIEQKKKDLKQTGDSFRTLKNRCNQIIQYLPSDLPITHFKGREGTRLLKQRVCDPKNQEGRGYTAKRFRRLLNNIFDYAVLPENCFLHPELAPIGLDKPFLFEKDIPKSKPHPHLHWNDFLGLIENFNLKQNINGDPISCGRLTHLSWIASLMMMIRVSGVVCLEWEWLKEDSKGTYWELPAKTVGVKRDAKDEHNPHYIPMTLQLGKLIDYLRSINGHQKYVFYSPFKGNNDYMSAQTPNSILQRMGYQGEQDVHGFRHVMTNTLIDEKGKNERDISRCLGHLLKEDSIGNYDYAMRLDLRKDILESWHSLLINDAGLKI